MNNFTIQERGVSFQNPNYNSQQADLIITYLILIFVAFFPLAFQTIRKMFILDDCFYEIRPSKLSSSRFLPFSYDLTLHIDKAPVFHNDKKRFSNILIKCCLFNSNGSRIVQFNLNSASFIHATIPMHPIFRFVLNWLNFISLANYQNDQVRIRLHHKKILDQVTRIRFECDKKISRIYLHGLTVYSFNSNLAYYCSFEKMVKFQPSEMMTSDQMIACRNLSKDLSCRYCDGFVANYIQKPHPTYGCPIEYVYIKISQKLRRFCPQFLNESIAPVNRETSVLLELSQFVKMGNSARQELSTSTKNRFKVNAILVSVGEYSTFESALFHLFNLSFLFFTMLFCLNAIIRKKNVNFFYLPPVVFIASLFSLLTTELFANLYYILIKRKFRFSHSIFFKSDIYRELSFKCITFTILLFAIFSLILWSILLTIRLKQHVTQFPFLSDEADLKYLAYFRSHSIAPVSSREEISFLLAVFYATLLVMMRGWTMAISTIRLLCVLVIQSCYKRMFRPDNERKSSFVFDTIGFATLNSSESDERNGEFGETKDTKESKETKDKKESKEMKDKKESKVAKDSESMLQVDSSANEFDLKQVLLARFFKDGLEVDEIHIDKVYELDLLTQQISQSDRIYLIKQECEFGTLIPLKKDDILLSLYNGSQAPNIPHRLDNGKLITYLSSVLNMSYENDLQYFRSSLKLEQSGNYSFCVEHQTIKGYCVHQGRHSYVTFIAFDKEISLVIVLAITALALFLSALTSGLTLGIMSLDTHELQVLIKAGNKEEQNAAKAIYPLRKKGNFLLCTFVIANTVSESLLNYMVSFLVTGPLLIVFSTIFLVIFGQIIPLAISTRYGLELGASTIYITYFFIFITLPAAYPLSIILDKFLGEETPTVYDKERLIEYIKLTRPINKLEKDQLNMISGVVYLRDKTVGQAMTKLSDVFMISIDMVLTQVNIKNIFKKGFSRIPVYKDKREKIVSILFLKDLVLLNGPITVKELVQNTNHYLAFTDETEKITKKFYYMKKVRRTHPASYSVTGIITLEDIIEEILQTEISDEADYQKDAIKARHADDMNSKLIAQTSKLIGKPSRLEDKPSVISKRSLDNLKN